MDQIISFVEAHTADILILLLGVFTSICNFIIMYFRTKTSRLENIVNKCLRPHLDDKSVLNNYYVKIENKLYKLADLELIKREASSGSTLIAASDRVMLDASSFSKVS